MKKVVRTQFAFIWIQSCCYTLTWNTHKIGICQYSVCNLMHPFFLHILPPCNTWNKFYAQQNAQISIKTKCFQMKRKRNQPKKSEANGKKNTLWWWICNEKRFSNRCDGLQLIRCVGDCIAMHRIINAFSVYLIILYCIDFVIGSNTSRCVCHFTHLCIKCDPNGKHINYLLSKVM